MARNLPSPMIAGITSNSPMPCLLLDLTLVTGVQYVWSGVGTVTYNGNSYTGVGSFGSIGDIVEGTDVKADGTTVTLSGIDPKLMNDCLNEIQLGAPVTLWFALFSAGVIATATPLFVGTVDKPMIPIRPDTLAITLNLENRMINLQRASNRRYTSGDQQYYYADDCGFHWVETLNDAAWVWGA